MGVSRRAQTERIPTESLLWTAAQARCEVIAIYAQFGTAVVSRDRSYFYVAVGATVIQHQVVVVKNKRNLTSRMHSLLRALLVVCIAGLPRSVVGGLYGDHVTELTAANFKSEVIESASTWVVKFYAPWCGHCQQSAPAFTKAAKKLDGVARVGVVNCDEEKELASKYGIRGFPTIKTFSGNSKKARRPSDYQGARSSSAIVEHAKYILPSYTARVKESGLSAFFGDEGRLPHVLLFTDKSTTSPLYKGMAAEFHGRISFGEVRKNDAGALIEKYSVESFPKLLAFKPGESETETAIVHTGALDPKSLRAFLGSISEGTTPEAGADSGDAKAGQQDPVFRQPQAFRASFEPVSSGREYADLCGSRKDGRMCGLAFLPGGAQNSLVPELNLVAEKFQFDNMAFAVVDTTSEDEGAASLAAAYGITDSQTGGFVYVRARKSKYAALDQDAALDAESVRNFLDSIVSGNGRFKKLSTELPAWPGRESTDDATGDAGGEPMGNATHDDGLGAETNDSAQTDAGDEGSCGLEPPADGGSCGA